MSDHDKSNGEHRSGARKEGRYLNRIVWESLTYKDRCGNRNEENEKRSHGNMCMCGRDVFQAETLHCLSK